MLSSSWSTSGIDLRSFARTRLRRYDDTLASSSEVPLFYTNPLTGDFQDHVGWQYHAMEIFNTFATMEGRRRALPGLSHASADRRRAAERDHVDRIQEDDRVADQGAARELSQTHARA